MRALASSGRLSVHAVKGAELMDRWVGASEGGARVVPSGKGFRALDGYSSTRSTRWRRGVAQNTDSGVTDRVVAALLTELDGIEPLRDVVVLGATNRPDLIDPALLRRAAWSGWCSSSHRMPTPASRSSRRPRSRCR